MATPNLFPVSNSATATSSMHILSAFKRSSNTTTTTTAAATNSVSSRRNTSPTSETARSSKSFSPSEERRPSLVVSLPSKLKIRRKKSVENHEPVTDGEAAQRLADRFFSLPSEILTQIFCNLDRFDIYNVRRSFRMFSHVLDINASAISKHILSSSGDDNGDVSLSSSYAPTVIYPPIHPCVDLKYLLTMLHRQRIIDRAIYHTLSFVQMKTYMTQGPMRDATQHFDRQKVIDAFQQPAWTICHFLESYRAVLVDEHSTHTASVGKFWDCHLCTTSTQRIVDSYPAAQVMPAYHFYQIVMMHFRAALRAPSSAGKLERRLRGWARSPTTDESLAIFTILGGLEEMSKMSMMQGSYGKRLELVMAFVDRVRLSAGSPGSAGGRIVVQSSRKGSVVSALQPVHDLTASLDPPFQRLTQDHLDRLPARVDDFFFPLWQERIARDGLAKHGTDDASAFKWIHNITHGYYGDEDEDEDEDEDDENEAQESLPLT